MNFHGLHRQQSSWSTNVQLSRNVSSNQMCPFVLGRKKPPLPCQTDRGEGVNKALSIEAPFPARQHRRPQDTTVAPIRSSGRGGRNGGRPFKAPFFDRIAICKAGVVMLSESGNYYDQNNKSRIVLKDH